MGLFDLTSFGKIEVTGRDAVTLLERVAGNRNRPAGSVVYTQFLTPRGGIAADVTVTRMAEDRFRVVTGSATVDADLGWLRAHVADGDDVALREASEEHAVIGLWGPRAREVLASVTDDDVSNDGFPYLRGRVVDVGGAVVWAQRIAYVGELGWELVEPEWAVPVWDRLMEAGGPHGIAVCGYRALDNLRIEGVPLLPDGHVYARRPVRGGAR
ncbi:MAG: hypothetical protein U0V56_09795 [Actinomycetota bacterium]